jgi:CheY-like chemotaxis protein
MKRVLVVDDEADYRMIVRTLLIAEGYEVVMAAHGEEALQKLEDQPFDLIVSDIYMPVMDGIKFYRTVRMMAAYQELPFLFVSARDDTHALDAIRDPRFDGFLRKGRPVEELLDWIEYLTTPESARPSTPPGGARSRLKAQLRAARRGSSNP